MKLFAVAWLMSNSTASHGPNCPWARIAFTLLMASPISITSSAVGSAGLPDRAGTLGLDQVRSTLSCFALSLFSRFHLPFSPRFRESIVTQPILTDAAELIALLTRYDCGALPPGIAARVTVLIAAAHRLQADALDIEAQAKRRLANE